MKPAGSRTEPDDRVLPGEKEVGKVKAMEIIKDKESSGPVEDRVAVLEKKMKDMEALVKGLTEELLDLKSIAMRLNKVSEERRTELRMVKPSTAATGAASSTVIMQKRPGQPSGSVRVPQPVPEPEPEKMDMIMQPDGTLKPEKRRGDREYIVASAGFAKKKQGSSQGSGKRNDLIVAEEEEKDSSGNKQ